MRIEAVLESSHAFLKDGECPHAVTVRGKAILEGRHASLELENKVGESLLRPLVAAVNAGPDRSFLDSGDASRQRSEALDDEGRQ